jgi:hypothetical protein
LDFLFTYLDAHLIFFNVGSGTFTAFADAFSAT